MGIPPVVVGLIVYFFFAHGGPLGAFQLLYTPTAMIIAQILIVFPIVTSLSHEIFAQNWQKYKDQSVLLIGIDRDEPLETVIAFQKKIGTTYPLALDPGANIFGLFANKEAGVTRNVVIDKTGKIVFLTRLFEEQEYQEMLSVLKKLTI